MKLLPYIYLTALLLAAVLPINGTDSTLNNNSTFSIRWDYLLHGLIYLPLPLMMKPFVPHLLKLLLVSLIIAGALELIQIWLPFRTFNVIDLMSNAIGVIAGMVLVVIARGSKKRLEI